MIVANLVLMRICLFLKVHGFIRYNFYYIRKIKFNHFQCIVNINIAPAVNIVVGTRLADYTRGNYY